MKLLRPLILTLAIAGGFFYFTTWRSNSRASASHPASLLSHPTDVEITEAARKEVLRRMAAQLPDDEKIKAADYVIDNSSSLEATRQQVNEIWKTLRGDAQQSSKTALSS